MRKTLALMTCGGAIVAGAVFAGTVIGDDGSTPLIERLQPGAFERAGGEVELAGAFERSAATASGGKKIQILKGASKSRTVAGGDSDSLNLRCPNKTSALSAGFETSEPGVVPGALAPSLTKGGKVDPRGMFVGVINLAADEIDWRVWVTCAKGVKDVS